MTLAILAAYRLRALATRPCARFLCTPSSSTKAEPNTSEEKHQQSNNNSSNLREQLCEATLKKIDQHGWTANAVEAALNDFKLSPASASLLPGGIAYVAHYLDTTCNVRLAQHLFSLQQRHRDAVSAKEEQQVTNDVEDDDKEELKEIFENASARAAYAMHYRLTLLDDLHQQWHQAIGLRVRLPREALNNRLLLSDEIAAFANYNSPSMAWYADRAVIGSIYQAAELYWLTDTSKQRNNTKDLICRRLDNAHSLRTKVSSSFSRVMNIYDAATATTSSLLRASRNSY